ncbi:putative nuclear pore complex protein [Apostichopus japonicus]|uniref:Putative nuclear pore complex protein n=1 Tax=Stichopus japonicus TaxID=307972 RepID=A0A2G8KVN7_STIJA|nr:putative nuclear pore complex protein [Apostichopus japonicus]
MIKMALYNAHREAPILKGENCHWKELTINTGASQPVLQDVNYPECSGGFTYRQNITSRGSDCKTFRSVFWRTSQSTLELLEVSTSQNLIGNALRLTFQDTPIVPRVCIQETFSEVVVLVTTINGVYRLLFPHPSKMHRKDTQHSSASVPSIFANTSVTQFRDPSNFHEFNHGGSVTFDLQCTSAWLTPETKAWFALGTKGGSLLLICLTPIGLKGVSFQEEVREASIMQRIWSGIVPGAMRRGQETSDTADSVVVRPFGQVTAAFTVCRDHRLRAWSCSNQECIVSFNLLELLSTGSEMSDEPPLLHHMIRAAEGAPLKSPILGVFLSLSKSNVFLILQPFLQSGQYQIQHLATIYGVKGRTLVDFTLSNSDLIVVWSLPMGDTLTQRYPYDGKGSKGRWTIVTGETPPPSEVEIPQMMEPREAYMDVIFRPGNFSRSCISKALNTYSRAVGLPLPVASNWYNDVNSLRAEVSAVIENEIQQKIGGGIVSQEDYRQLLEQSLARFYSCCLEYQRVADKPGGLVLDVATGLTYIVKKDAVSVLVPSDHVVNLSEGSRPEDLCENGWIQEDDTVLVHDVWQLYNCVRSLRKLCHGNHYEDLIASEDLAQVTARSIAEDIICSPDVSELVLLLENLHKPSRALKTVLEMLDLAEGKPDGLLPSDDFIYSSEPDMRLFGDISTRMLAAGFSSLVVSRFHFLVDLLLLESIMDKLAMRPSSDKKLQSALEETLIPETAKLMQAYLSLHRFSQWEATTIQSGSIESSIRQMAALEISEFNYEESAVGANPGDANNLTLVELFIAGSGGVYMRAILGQGEGQLREWNSLSYHAIITLAKLMWPISASFIFPEFLMNKCQYTNVEKYVKLLDRWCEWNAASRRFMLGHSYLNLGAPEKAVACFTQAAHRATKEDFLMRKILPTDELEGKREDTVYHLKVIRLLEQFSIPDLVIEYSQSALSFAVQGDKNISLLWPWQLIQTLKYKYLSPDGECMERGGRRDCLRQFVVVLCERGQSKDLVELPYIDLHDEMVAILEERARSVDLTRNSYYDLLYSFHIHRGNYRKAASAMYEHASRLAVELPGINSLQQQCNCYLATLNTLRIVDPKYQWIVKPVAVLVEAKAEDLAGASPKRDFDGDLRNMPVTRREVQVLELADIENEYLLVSARWKLANFDSEFDFISATAMTVDETVANLVRAGLFDCAIEVCQSFKLKLTPVFESLASKCVRVSRSGANSKTWRWLSANTPAKLHCSKESSPADLAWDLLKVYLTRHHRPGDSAYYKVVTSKLLSLGFSLPQWLIKSLKQIDYPVLLRLYISYDKLEEAALLAIELIQAVRGELGDGYQDFGLKAPLRSTEPSVWLPYSSLDHILLALQHTKDPGLLKIYQRLNNKMQVYQEEARRVSEEMVEIAIRKQ